jgi:kynurenine formamidase
MGATMRIIDLSSALTLEEFAKDTHTGTHLDAPAYLLKNQRTIDNFGLESFFSDAVILDLSHTKPGEAVDDEDLEGAEEEAGLALREGEAAIVYTGGLVKPHAYLSENAAQYLEFKRVGMVGIDAPSIDSLTARDLPAHLTLLKSGILVLEGLCNLEEVDVPRFRLAAFPLKVNAPTSPVRALAILE